MTVTVGWMQERFDVGWYLTDVGEFIANGSAEHMGAPLDPVRWENDKPVYSPLRQRLIDHGQMTIACRICGEPSWQITRHAAERHGDPVEVMTPLPGHVRPDWFHPDWI